MKIFLLTDAAICLINAGLGFGASVHILKSRLGFDLLRVLLLRFDVRIVVVGANVVVLRAVSAGRMHLITFDLSSAARVAAVRSSVSMNLSWWLLLSSKCW